jgi:hypothetical protein
MTKHSKFIKEQEDFILHCYDKIKKNKTHKINTQLVLDFNSKYPNVTVTYNQLYYIIVKKSKVRSFIFIKS